MNEDKIVELKSRIEDSDIRKYNNEIKQTEARVSELILNLVFYNQDSIHCLLLMNLMVICIFVSEEQK
jgi:hypothetical protein